MRTSKLIRSATLDDVARVVELGLRFYGEEGGRPASPKALASFMLSHIGVPDRVLLISGEPIAAGLCGMIAPHYLTGEPTAFKTAWYAIPEARGYGAHLLRAFEAWAKAKGARRLIVAGRSERTLALLERLHFQPLETVYSKDLPWQKQPFPSS
ncbi:MAG: GNAT family N-acetyltransferase [Rhodomicrobium sp.]|jgi:GNAT superfamily N-acetyltransferase